MLEPRLTTFDPVLTCAGVFVCLFGAAWIGYLLRSRLPDHHLSNETKESVRIGMGSVATMAALVLGLLVASTKSAYDTEKSEVMQLAAKLVYLDQLLASYGPESAEARRLLKRATESAILRIWPEVKATAGTLAPDRIWTRDLPQTMQNLSPKDDAQRAFKSQATAVVNDLGQLRWLLFEQMDSAISAPLLVIMVFWLALTFLSVAVFAPANGTSIAAQCLGAFSIAGAVFLILELDQPFHGLVKISSRPLVTALQHLEK